MINIRNISMLALVLGVFATCASASTFKAGDLLLSKFEGTVDRYDISTGTFVESVATGLGHAGATAFDPSGRLWVGAGGGTIQVWNTSGWVMTLPSGSSLIDKEISGIAQGTDGYMYAIDKYERKIRKFNANTGALVAVVADVAALYPAGLQATDLKFGPDGNIWIPMANMTVQRFSTAGALLSTYFTDVTLGGSNTTTSDPGQIAFGPDGNHFMYNCAYYHGVSILRNFDTAWVGLWNNFSIDGATGLALAADGTWYVCTKDYGTIVKLTDSTYNTWAEYDGTGMYLTLIPKGPTTFKPGDLILSTFEGTVDRYDITTGSKVESLATGLGHAGATAFDLSGRLWVGDGAGAIQIWNTVGKEMTIPSGSSLPDKDISGMERGPDGNIYAIDRYERKIRKYNASTGALIGVVADVAALYPAGLQATDLKFGPDGNIWIPMANMSVQRFSLAGALLSTYFTDVTLGGTNTTTSAPGQIAFGSDGNHFMYNCAYYHGVSILRNFDTAWVGIWNNWSLDGARGLALASDGTWYVASGDYGTITKFTPADGRINNWATYGGDGRYLRLIPQPYVPICGDSLHPYPSFDFNHDCRVDFEDLKPILDSWLTCTNPSCIG